MTKFDKSWSTIIILLKPSEGKGRGARGGVAKLGSPPTLVAPLAQSTVYTSVQSTAYSLNNSAVYNIRLHFGTVYSLYNSAVYNLHSTVYKAAQSTIHSLHIGVV